MLFFECEGKWDLVGQDFFCNGEFAKIVSVAYVIHGNAVFWI